MLVEGRRAGDDQQEAGETAGVDLVDELTQRIECLVAGVGAYSLQGFHLVEDEQQAGMAAVAQHGQQALQEAHRGEVIEVALDPGRSAGRRGDVRLTAEPGGHAIGGGMVARGGGRPIAA